MNLNGRPTNPGELRTPITLQTPTVVRGTGGAQRAGYTTLATVLAKWTNAFGNEVWVSQAGGRTVSPATVRIRYRSDVDGTCQVLKGSQVYEIVGGVDNIQERGEYLEFKVRLLEGNVT